MSPRITTSGQTGAVGADLDVADEHGRGIDEDPLAEQWRFALVGTNGHDSFPSGCGCRRLYLRWSGISLAKVANVSANPLLQAYDLPPFSSIRPEHVKPAIERILADNRAAIARLLETQREQPTWKGLVLAMDELNDRLGAA